jgi:outer membrane protein assembly factor BamB
LNKDIFAVGILALLIISTIGPIVFGYTIKIYNTEKIEEMINFNSYNESEIFNLELSFNTKKQIENKNTGLEKTAEFTKQVPMSGKSIDSPWPMYCHDVRHTGRSPYSTDDNFGDEKWNIKLQGLVWGSPIIDNNGIIYIGAWDFYAIYPNGTIKWQIDISAFSSAPIIDENGIIYTGTIWAMPNFLYSIYPNGTIKWKYNMGNDDIFSSPAIGDDGTIYFGSGGDYPWYGHINALYPNGTLRWRYETGYEVYSSPVIGNDGTIYCGSHDGYLYALNLNNGTLKWKYKTGDWIGRGPSIADDGTIYFGSWDGYLYAVYTNGTLKWKTGGYLAGTTPITGADGTIYVGNKKLFAIYPENGTVKWSFNLEQDEDIRGSNPCISADDTIYFGTYEGGRIYAVNDDGTEKWQKYIGGNVLSAPAIGEDGTVYIGDGRDDGSLHAFGPLDSNAPSAPEIDGPKSGKTGIEYDFTFESTSPLGNDVFYWIEWGDGNIENWIGPYSPGEEIIESHTWSEGGTYQIKARTKDSDNLWGPWSEFEITIPRTRDSNLWYQSFLKRFPILERLLNLLL